MTRQEPSSPPASPSSERGSADALLRPVQPTRSLSDEVCNRLAEEITSGKLKGGEKLPSEQEMMTAMGVSRTVIREAVAALRARGLVVTRQGAGAFVNPDPSRQPYVIDPDGLGSLTGVIEVLELRMAVEAEAAAIASERASAQQLKDIRAAHEELNRVIERGDRGIREDLAFHRAIAVATQNNRFVEFLEYLGRLIIPRQSIRSFEGEPEEMRSYLERIETEHEAIMNAIEARSPKKARDAMRKHLLNSRERYRQLASASEAR
ncbi:MAG: FadR/GntR family transcriptional regulator [Pseudomonadota bacterium]|jgi:DNA-binding FadR family transcriptional regulator